VEIGGSAVAGFGIIAAVADFAFFGSKNKKKQKHWILGNEELKAQLWRSFGSQ